MDNDDIWIDWYRFGDMDLEAAEILRDYSRQKPLEIICYHCQQSVEKYLKGYLIANGEKAPRTHDLRLLQGLCYKIDPAFDDIADTCDTLTVYSVQPRYPAESHIGESEAIHAISEAKMVQAFVSKMTNEMLQTEQSAMRDQKEDPHGVIGHNDEQQQAGMTSPTL